MSNPLIYVIWLLATGAVILGYVYRRRHRSDSLPNETPEKADRV
jgi:hypothetical protein